MMDNGYAKRPTILQFEHIKHHPQCHEAYNFIREASTVWSRSKLGIVVPDALVHDLFHQLNLHPTKEQINDMLRNAKLYSSNLKFCNGLSLGEFSVLAADYRKFSSRTSQNGHHQPFQITSLSPKSSLRVKKQIFIDQNLSTTTAAPITTTINGGSATDGSNNGDESKIEAAEVFLGGSCNPTTWRADVAMPELTKLGISYFNPQVSQWTPDLVQLEHQAKQKARVLFFVMDSQTRASGAAIEVAHIAGQNTKPLILVLQPYKRNQQIFNESISEEEFLDLSRNQRILKQLVSRRGLLVHDNILLGLQQIKNVLAGEGPCNPPKSVGSRLISVRRSFDRVVSNEMGLTLKQCSQQLLSLGYRKDLVSIENLKRILSLVRNVLNNHESSVSSTESSSSSSSELSDTTNWEAPSITFEEFCVVSSYLSVLQQEIEENCCVSPIKGTNLPPPPIFLTNTPEVLNQYSKQCSQTDENTIVGICSQQQQQQQRHALNRSFTVDGSAAVAIKDDREPLIMTMSNGPRSDSSRDSGTSSPQPIESKLLNGNSGSSLNTKMSIHNRHADIGSSTSTKITDDDYNDIDSDSSDSVFSTSSSLDEDSMHEVRDIYLGGSCMLRTKWRKDIAIPYLKSKNISFYVPTIHDNLALRETKTARKFNKDKIESGGYTLEETTLSPISSSDELIFNPRILDSSRVLLFVITNETRSLAPMTLAAHYIGLAYNVVLCIQMLPENCTIGQDKLTPSAIKDYNRGRTYLRDLAERQNIPVFNEIKKALDCAIDKVKLSKPRCSV